MRGECFYRKEIPKGMPAGTPTKRLPNKGGSRAFTNYVVGGSFETQNRAGQSWVHFGSCDGLARQDISETRLGLSGHRPDDRIIPRCGTGFVDGEEDSG